MSGYLLWRARPEAALGLVSDQRVVPAADAPALLQAQALLARVDQLLSETEAQCQVLREAAREQGLREGLAEAEARLQAQLEEAQATQLAQLAAANQQLRQQWQQSLAELALAIHNKLMGELPAQEQLARLALQAARELLPARCWRLAVPPAQLAGLREALQALDPQNRAGLQDSELIADPALPALGCRLLTDLGSADASLETQLQRIASAWGADAMNSALEATPALQLAQLARLRTVATLGRVVQASGTLLRATGVQARIGQTCRVFDPLQPQQAALQAEVIGFAGQEAVLAPLGSLQGLPVGAAVEVQQEMAQLPSGAALLGRVIDAFGQPLDGGAPLDALPRVPLYREPPAPLQRRMIERPLVCGVRAIDALLSVGEGQRLGIFAMAGGGKSTLLGMLARNTRADVSVIGLIGERGREVREFIEDSLGAEGLARSVVVASTSDRPALERVRAAHAATAIAEGFRDQGARVLLMMDSVTRFARGLRELGLAAGEPAVRRGYPPSVFAELPRLFERAGADDKGSITAFYTVLAEDEEGSDPVAEEVRSILDGHLLLSRALAQAQHYPAIDVLASASRVAGRVTGRDHQRDAARLRALLARHKEVEFLLRVGEYQSGSDALADQAIARMPQIEALLRQPTDECSDWDGCLQQLRELVQ